MKSLFTASLVTLFTLISVSTASARDIDGGWDVGGPVVRYLSWCTQNVLVVEGPQGQAIPKFNCTAYGRVCRQQETKKGPYLFVSAACVAPVAVRR